MDIPLLISHFKPASVVNFFPLDDWAVSGTARSIRTAGADNATYGSNGTGVSVGALQNGYYHIDCSGTHTQPIIDLTGTGSETRFDYDVGYCGFLAQIDTWTDGTTRRAWQYITNNSNVEMSMQKLNTNNTFRVQRVHFSGGTVYRNIDNGYSDTDWHWYMVRWEVSDDIMQFRVDGRTRGTIGTILAGQAHTVTDFNILPSFEPWADTMQFWTSWNADFSPANLRGIGTVREP